MHLDQVVVRQPREIPHREQSVEPAVGIHRAVLIVLPERPLQRRPAGDEPGLGVRGVHVAAYPQGLEHRPGVDERLYAHRDGHACGRGMGVEPRIPHPLPQSEDGACRVVAMERVRLHAQIDAVGGFGQPRILVAPYHRGVPVGRDAAYRDLQQLADAPLDVASLLVALIVPMVRLSCDGYAVEALHEGPAGGVVDLVASEQVAPHLDGGLPFHLALRDIPAGPDRVVAVVVLKVPAAPDIVVGVLQDGLDVDYLAVVVHVLHGRDRVEAEAGRQVLARLPCMPAGRIHLAFRVRVLLVVRLHPLAGVLVVQRHAHLRGQLAYVRIHRFTFSS